MTITVGQDVPGMEPMLLWLLRDLTERKRLEAELQRTEHLALLGKLAASVSHEIRDPLSAISLFIELLEGELRQHQLPAALHTRMLESLAEIHMARTRMQNIVEDYLSLARGWDLQREPTDLGAFLLAFAEDMALFCASHGITLCIEGLADLGVVRLHQSTFRRALLNLVQNAIDAMPQGGTLTLHGQHTTEHFILEVRDTGSGIPAEQLPQLFMPLHTTKAQGTGLGLYVVQEIIAAHGAGLVVQSKPNHGTTFTITLPREPDMASPNWPTSDRTKAKIRWH
jgi:signal transduction histidine kinase